MLSAKRSSPRNVSRLEKLLPWRMRQTHRHHDFLQLLFNGLQVIDNALSCCNGDTRERWALGDPRLGDRVVKGAKIFADLPTTSNSASIAAWTISESDDSVVIEKSYPERHGSAGVSRRGGE